jgi:hypothetical protein
MSSFSNQLSQSSNLLKALDAATNWRAIAMEALSFAAFMIILALGVATGSGFVGMIMSLIAVVAMVIGFSATGYLLMDQAKGQPVRGFLDALLAGVFTLHRLIGVLILEVIIFVLVLLAIAVLILICKIPGLGPILYTVVFPVSAVVAGCAFLALFYVGLSMLAPSVWDGNTVMGSIARLLTIVRQRLLPVVISLVILYLLVVFVGLITFGVAIIGTASIAGLSASILGYSSGMGLGMLSSLQNMMQYGGGFDMSGYGLAMVIGSALLYFAAALIPSVVSIAGINIIYLQISEGLDFKSAESSLSKHMDDAKRRAQNLQSRATESRPTDE